VRLRWESATPIPTGRRLAETLGLRLRTVDDLLEIDLGGAVLEFASLLAGQPGDDRLRLIDASDAGDAGGEVPGGRPFALAALGFATVDAERAAWERGWRADRAEPDRLLGADVAVVASPAGVLLLEPNTEGRIAASLARWGEGPAALYLAPGAAFDRARDSIVARGGAVSATSRGPFGRAFALDGGRAWGPHVLVVESGAVRPAARTIGP
jgi:hypothetical protein